MIWFLSGKLLKRLSTSTSADVDVEIKAGDFVNCFQR